MTGHTKQDEVFPVKYGFGGSGPLSPIQLARNGPIYPGAAIEPMPVEEEDYIRMNIDKGGGAQGEEAMVVLGNIGIPGDEETYQLIQRDNLQIPVQITTDSNGSMWLIMGTDSGFEGTTTLYYNSVEVQLMD